jgi:hypothetical protein
VPSQGWVWGSAESLAGIAGDTGLELLAQAGVIETFTDQYELGFARTAPIAVIEGEALAGEMKNMAAFAFVKPKNSFGTENGGGELVIEKVLELAQGEGPFTAE